MEGFKGKWLQTSAELYDEFLKALDVGWMLRKAAQVSMQEMTISCEGETWTIFTSTTLKNMTKVFKVISATQVQVVLRQI